MYTSVRMAGGSLAERRDVHQRDGADEQTDRHGSVPIRVPVDHRAARTRHPDAVALDAAVEITTILVLLEEGLECVEEGHARQCS
jgi:hypothetical protein